MPLLDLFKKVLSLLLDVSLRVSQGFGSCWTCHSLDGHLEYSATVWPTMKTETSVRVSRSRWVVGGVFGVGAGASCCGGRVWDFFFPPPGMIWQRVGSVVVIYFLTIRGSGESHYQRGSELANKLFMRSEARKEWFSWRLRPSDSTSLLYCMPWSR